MGEFPKISSEAFVLNEIIEMKKRGHKIKILAGGKEDQGEHEDVQKYFLKGEIIYPRNYKEYTRGRQKVKDFVIRLSQDFPQSPLRTIKSLYNILIYERKAWKIIDAYLRLKVILGKNENFDLVHVPFAAENNLYIGWKLAKYFCCPLTTTLRSRDIYNRKERERLLRQRFLRGVEGIFTISHYNQKNLETDLKRKISIVHSAIYPERFQRISEKKIGRIITICRAVEKKGIIYLIKALRILKKRKIKFKWLFIGGGPQEREYKKLIRRYELSKEVKLIDFVSQNKIKQHLSEASVFVLPCIVASDGDMDMLPNVLKEAMAMEVPVITTKMPGIEELIIDGKTGILVPQKNSVALADAIENVLNGKTKLDLKKAREKIVRDFNIKIEAEKLEKIFLEVLKKNKSLKKI